MIKSNFFKFNSSGLFFKINFSKLMKESRGGISWIQKRDTFFSRDSRKKAVAAADPSVSPSGPR